MNACIDEEEYNGPSFLVEERYSGSGHLIAVHCFENEAEFRTENDLRAGGHLVTAYRNKFEACDQPGVSYYPSIEDARLAFMQGRIEQGVMAALEGSFADFVNMNTTTQETAVGDNEAKSKGPSFFLESYDSGFGPHLSVRRYDGETEDWTEFNVRVDPQLSMRFKNIEEAREHFKNGIDAKILDSLEYSYAEYIKWSAPIKKSVTGENEIAKGAIEEGLPGNMEGHAASGSEVEREELLKELNLLEHARDGLTEKRDWIETRIWKLDVNAAEIEQEDANEQLQSRNTMAEKERGWMGRLRKIFRWLKNFGGDGAQQTIPTEALLAGAAKLTEVKPERDPRESVAKDGVAKRPITKNIRILQIEEEIVELRNELSKIDAQLKALGERILEIERRIEMLPVRTAKKAADRMVEKVSDLADADRRDVALKTDGFSNEKSNTRAKGAVLSRGR